MSFILNALDIEVFPRKELFGILNLSSQNYTFGATDSIISLGLRLFCLVPTQLSHALMVT